MTNGKLTKIDETDEPVCCPVASSLVSVTELPDTGSGRMHVNGVQSMVQLPCVK
jgi:hypothetical protein